MAGDLSWFNSQIHQHVSPFLEISDVQVASLFTHYQFLLRWNPKLNLTSIRSPEEIVLRHYCESLFFSSQLSSSSVGIAVGDIGSGAGFPGVGVAVLHPEWHVTLVESHQRKAVFLRESTRHLRNVSVSSTRAEDVSCRFGLLVSRAVDPSFVLGLVPQGSRVALLIGADDWSTVARFAGFEWFAPVQLPWGERRIFVCGECVSRGT